MRALLAAHLEGQHFLPVLASLLHCIACCAPGHQHTCGCALLLQLVHARTHAFKRKERTISGHRAFTSSPALFTTHFCASEPVKGFSSSGLSGSLLHVRTLPPALHVQVSRVAAVFDPKHIERCCQGIMPPCARVQPQPLQQAYLSSRGKACISSLSNSPGASSGSRQAHDIWACTEGLFSGGTNSTREDNEQVVGVALGICGSGTPTYQMLEKTRQAF